MGTDSLVGKEKVLSNFCFILYFAAEYAVAGRRATASIDKLVTPFSFDLIIDKNCMYDVRVSASSLYVSAFSVSVLSLCLFAAVNITLLLRKYLYLIYLCDFV